MKEICVVVDMINGFINEGPLADKSILAIVPETIKVIQKHLDEGKDVLSFQDTHTLDSLEFKSYPPHCLKDTSESDFIDSNTATIHCVFSADGDFIEVAFFQVD